MKYIYIYTFNITYPHLSRYFKKFQRFQNFESGGAFFLVKFSSDTTVLRKLTRIGYRYSNTFSTGIKMHSLGEPMI